MDGQHLWQVPRMWDGGRCIVIGGGPSMPSQFGIPNEVVAKVRDKSDPLGPSAYSSYMEAIHGEHVIVVNNGYLLGDWPDICFFADYGWYRVHRESLAQWPGLKIGACPPLQGNSDGVKYLKRLNNSKGFSLKPHLLNWNYNSGSAAINLAIHLGAAQIILLGFDMCRPEGRSHWHQGHGNELLSDGRPRPLPNYAKWARALTAIAQDAAKLGVEIINCSPGTVITAFPVANIREVL